MKKGNTKRNFEKFSKKNVHKRRAKEKSLRSLAAALEEVNSNYNSNIKFKDAIDRGRAGRESFKSRRDEVRAQGCFSASKSGYGFVGVEGEERDIFIPADKCAGAIDGDIVEIIYHSYMSGGIMRTEGRVKKILKYGKASFIGTVMRAPVSRRDRFRANRFQFLPDDPRVLLRPFILETAGISEGDKVEVIIDRSQNYGISPDCSIIRNFGDSETLGANYEAILSLCGIKQEFSKEELSEAEAEAKAPISYDGRAVRRGEIIFTIDGEDAKDLDDAVSIKKSEKGYTLGVHIADVSSYVKEKTALDRAVMSRGTSVYFTDKVVPMLPRSLSNGACSLNAGEEKYALSAIIELSRDGDILGVKIEKSVIVSSSRGVYSEINRIFAGDTEPLLLEKYKKIIPSLELMRELYLILAKRAEARGAMDFDADEAKIILDADGNPSDIIKRTRGISERMIEQFMICANVAVATELDRLGIPCVYRVHAEPPEEKMESFLTFAHNLGFDTSIISKDKSDVKALSALLRAAEERGLLAPISYAMLRSMAKAEYSKERSAHFGLGLSHYCHFTSPIRRLSDLATHRIIHKVMFEGRRAQAYTSYAARAAAAATEAELRAVDAERKIENLYKVIYMSGYIGCEFDAVISSVASFGIFCTLENTCEGLVPISELGAMFFFDEKNASMRSADIVFRLGDRVRIRVEEASLSEAKLRFSLLPNENREAEI